MSSYKQNSLQGDAELVEIYKDFGVETIFENGSIILKKIETHSEKPIILDLNNCPDIAQTIAVNCFALGIGCHLSGLRTLKIKETDRLEALKTELSKLGAKVVVTNDSMTLNVGTVLNSNISISTYQDHRMAMSFAPLALKTDLIIENTEVVSKSYPNFWKDLEKIGFQIQ